VSASAETIHAAGHDAGGHDEPGFHVSLRGYLTGFGLAVILTAIPFYLVMSGVLGDKLLTAFVVVGFAAVQIVVHMIYFLHMSPRMEGGWSMMALLFTFIILVIVLSGSTWVMYHLNTNMMPMSVTQMQQMP